MTLVQNTSTLQSVSDVYQLVGEDTCARWEALGHVDSAVHWKYGEEAEQLISEGVPNMLAYKAIAKKAGKKQETIRQAYYTYKAFTPDQREQYELCPYSVFRHAKNTPAPLEVLQHYIDNVSTVDEVEEIFPATGEDATEKDFIQTGFPRMFYLIYREIWGMDAKVRNKIIGYLKVINRVIDEVNK
jgi:hypothetical protein